MKVVRNLLKLWYLLTYRFRKSRITVQQALLSGDNSFIDIRYGLSRPDKINPKSKPYIINEKTQDHLNLLHLAKFGAIQTKLRKGTYTGIMLFYNKDTSIKKGDLITLWWDTLNTSTIEVK